MDRWHCGEADNAEHIFPKCPIEDLQGRAADKQLVTVGYRLPRNLEEAGS